MANSVEFRGVVHIVHLWGQFCAPELFQTSNDQGCLSFSRVLSRETSSEKITDSIASRDYNPYTESEFLKICEDYRVPNDPMKYRDEKFYWTYQHGVHWPNDYIGPDSMTRWIMEGSVGFTETGLYKISEC